MPSKPNPIAEQNLIFAGLGLQLGILSKDKVIRAFTEWLFDKSKPLADILIQQKALSSEEANSLKVAVQAHIQKEGDQEKALASLHMVKDLESDLDHLGDNDLHQTIDSALIKRKELCLDEQFTRSRILEQSDQNNLFRFDGPDTKAKDRFERQHFFDAGNLGELYFAKDTELNRTVVTKYIKPERANESLTQALFHLEGEVTGALEHPSIVPVYGLGKDTKGRLFYAMRYIRGRKLSRVIRDYHAIPSSESGKKQESLIDLLQYFQSACLAIEYAHKKGVLHCDIKPDNIMIGDYGEVFIVDWGLVIVHGESVKPNSNSENALETLELGHVPLYKPSEAASSGLHKNQGGSRQSVGGTLAYMAPEQLKATNDGDVSLMGPASDIYALGGTLFQILTGQPPHLAKKKSKERIEDFYNRILTGDFPKPTELKPETSKALEAIALKALRLNPEDRYMSARDLADDVKRYLADEPVKAHQEGVLEKSLRFARKNRTVAGVAAALLVCLAFGGSLFGFITKGFNEKLQVFNEKLQVSEREANENAVLAKKNEAQAYAQKEATEKQLYINKIQRADSEFWFGDAVVALNQLTSIPFHQRGWEHDFLTTLANSGQVTLKGHTNHVRSASFSPDGKRIVSGSTDNTLKIWDATSGQEILTLNGHTDGVTSVSFSPDGKRIVSGSGDKTLKIWDATSGQEILTLKGHTDFVSRVSFSPDGKRIVSGSGDKTLKIWDANSGQEILTFNGHTGLVRSVSFSPDGKKIVSGSGDKTLKIWDAALGQEILTLREHTGEVTSASFSPDGKRIVSGSGDGSLKIWDATSGKKILTFNGHTGWVSSVSFSPDGKKIVSASVAEDNPLKIWDAYTGQEISKLKGKRHTSNVNSVSFSPDGKRIVSGSNDKTLKIWDVTNGQILTLKGHTKYVTSVSHSPDGKRIVSGSGDGSLKIWDATSGQEILTFKGHTGPVESVGFSPDGKKIVSGSYDKTLKIWDAASGQAILTLKVRTGWVSSVSFNPDGKKIVSASFNVIPPDDYPELKPFGNMINSRSADKTLKIWDATSGQEILTFNGHTGWVRSVSFSPDGKKIVSASEAEDNPLKIWDATSGQEILSLKGHTDEITSLSFSPDGKKIVGGSYDKTLKIWDAISGQEILTFKGHTDEVVSVNFSPDGKRVVSGSGDKTLKIWDATSGQEILTLNGHTDRVSSVSFSPDGKRVVSGSGDRTLKIWDAASGQEIFILKGITGLVTSVSFSPDGRKIACGKSDTSLKIWDTNLGQEILTFNGHTGGVISVSYSPDGERIVSGSGDKTLKIWNANSGQEILTLKGHTKTVSSVSFSPDGKRIVSGSGDNTLKIWDAASGQNILTLKGHTNLVSSLCFSPDGKRIVSGSWDDTLKIWDATSGQEIHTLKGHTENVTSVSFSPDGKRIVSGSLDTTIKIWDANSGQEIVTLKGHTDRVTSVSFSPDGKRIVSRDIEGATKIWDLESSAEIRLSEDKLKTYKSLSGSDISADKAWSVKADGSDLILINNKLLEERIARDRELLAKWSQPDPKWHSQNAEESEVGEQWFAAAFHLRKLIEIEPSNEAAKKRLQVAETNLKESK
jgi:eukaryotic-like serine/threonine-protein kinase